MWSNHVQRGLYKLQLKKGTEVQRVEAAEVRLQGERRTGANRRNQKAEAGREKDSSQKVGFHETSHTFTTVRLNK